MKVICIDNSPGKYNRNHTDLELNEIYTVVKERQLPNETLHYELAEKPEGPYFGAFRFRPVSEHYTDLTASIAAGVKETREAPDRVIIKEPVNNLYE